MNYIKQIFDMLGIEPNEEFRFNSQIGDKYKLNENLTLYIHKNSANCWLPSSNNISNILNGTLKIVKQAKPTKEEQLAIDYAKACGCKWIAKDLDDDVDAYTSKPFKGYESWISEEGEMYEIGIPISFIHWEDEEPYYIGDEEE